MQNAHADPALPALNPSVRDELQRMERSRAFYRVEVQMRLLRFLFEQVRVQNVTLREVEIGVNFYGRMEGYDARKDSIVRVSVNRLRQRLANYYATEGSENPVRIEIPRGSYIPIVKRGELSADKVPAAQRILVFWPIFAAAVLLFAAVCLYALVTRFHS